MGDIAQAAVGIAWVALLFDGDVTLVTDLLQRLADPPVAGSSGFFEYPLPRGALAISCSKLVRQVMATLAGEK